MSYMDVLILGSTSNICAKRVFDNLNNIYQDIGNIYCYDMKNITQKDFESYISSNVMISKKNMINNKIKYIYGNFDTKNYNEKIKKLLNRSLIIYVSIPPFCYENIINFFNENNNYYKLILEKPLALCYRDFCTLKFLFTDKMYVIDHFLYKRDIQNIIKIYRRKNFNKIKIKFLYQDDAEKRLGYFDNVGFYIDMFQSHYLSILYSLIGLQKIKKLLTMNIKTNIRKQYKNYGGKNNVDTYFYVELSDNINTYIFEGGKAMMNEEKIIEIDDKLYNINNYNDEYELFFQDIINDNINENMIKHHDIFWKITQNINNNRKMYSKLDLYGKNEVSSFH